MVCGSPPRPTATVGSGRYCADVADETLSAPVSDGDIELPESLAKASQRHADLSERVNEGARAEAG